MAPRFGFPDDAPDLAGTAVAVDEALEDVSVVGNGIVGAAEVKGASLADEVVVTRMAVNVGRADARVDVTGRSVGRTAPPVVVVGSSMMGSKGSTMLAMQP